MPMYGTDLYSNTRGGSSSSSNQGDPSYNSGSINQSQSYNNNLFNSTASTVPLTPSEFTRQPARLGRNYPLFRGSSVRVKGHYDLQTIRYNRVIGFSATPAPFLEGSRFSAVDVRKMISYIQQLLRADAYDESCLERLIDATARDFLHISFAPTRVQSNHQLDAGLGCGYFH